MTGKQNPNRLSRDFIKWDQLNIALLCDHLGDGDRRKGAIELAELLHIERKRVFHWLKKKTLLSRLTLTGLNYIAGRVKFKPPKKEEINVVQDRT